jgi:phosphate transport system protein
MRDHYIKQLQSVHDDLLRMGSRVEHQLADAIKALDRLDIELAREIVEHVFQLIATQQPVATDLRSLLAAIAIAGELERAADYAKGIAKKVERSPANAIDH